MMGADTKKIAVRFGQVFLLPLILLIGFSSCEDFLSVDSPNELSRGDLFETVRGADAAVAGLYFRMGGASYYQFRMPVYADLPGNLKAPTASGGNLGDFLGTQLGLLNLHARELTPALDNTGMESLYQSAYEVIFQANDILDALPDVTDGSPERIASLAAEARAIRAIVHFDLVRLFAQAPGFTADGSHPGVVTVDGLPGIFDIPARSTVAETYAFIQSDLEAALADLDISFSRRSSEPFWLTPAVVEGLLARVASYTGDWEACQRAATHAIAAANLQLTPADRYLEGWAEGSLTEILWELDLQRLTEDANDVRFQSPARIFGAGNDEPFMEVSDDLFTAYSEEDLRRQLFVRNENDVLLSGKWPFALNEIRNPPMLRLSELYLLRAEANVELGNLEAAAADYLPIHRRANPVAEAPTLDQALLREEIRRERRRELAFEGHHFFDLSRWGVGLIRQDCSPVLAGACDLPYPHPRFVLPIPFVARALNPNLTQNPGY